MWNSVGSTAEISTHKCVTCNSPKMATKHWAQLAVRRQTYRYLYPPDTFRLASYMNLWWRLDVSFFKYCILFYIFWTYSILVWGLWHIFGVHKLIWRSRCREIHVGRTPDWLFVWLTVSISRIYQKFNFIVQIFWVAGTHSGHVKHLCGWQECLHCDINRPPTDPHGIDRSGPPLTPPT